MPTLRLTQSSVSSDRFRVEAALEGDGVPRQVSTAEFDFRLSDQDREDLRWYLEDYLQHVADPAPKIAARVEGRIAEIGESLFKALFESSMTATRLWARLQPDLNSSRIEIAAGVREATAIPWELLRDPLTQTPLALEASSFVRTQTDMTRPVQATTPPTNGDEQIRILLVICRPGGGDDVPFRSVASRLIKGLNESNRKAFQLDVLRPPTFAQLGRDLRAARAEGNPYHVVHFDGHGAYQEFSEPGGLGSLRRGLSRLLLSASRTGAHGYLLFENPDAEENLQLVDGGALGQLLKETDVPVLVLNACRSGHAEAPAEPDAASARGAGVAAQVRAFGSLAQEVVNAGVAGVVAMRYNVYVVTAAQFVADLYESLASGRTLGEAVTLGRKQLQADPLREIAWEPRKLQDWIVPIVYEAAPVSLFPAPMEKSALKITITADAASPSTGSLARELQVRPDAGFFGRDETLLALDRAFDRQQIVLLHAYAGSGKTSTAAEFARWYQLTGGIEGPVLFTSFEQRKTLRQVLNETIGRVFGDLLERSDVQWLTLTDDQRRDVAFSVLAQIPVLWIWDNVEPIAGFPSGTPSKWTGAEQIELADFLRAAAQTQAKFLLTSRREERQWLGDTLPMRIAVPPMPMQERVQLARAIAEKYGRRLTDVDDWMPLLRFTRGNPLTITVLVGQALRDGLKTRAQIDAFVERLRSGEETFDDEISEGRDKSLGASLSYGFENAFTDAERRQLALLHFFQGFVDVDALRFMGNPDADWGLAEVRGLTREDGIALLDRAAEIGLLTALEGGYYFIHPALPWFFRSLFDRLYVSDSSSGDTPHDRVARAYVEALAMLGDFYQQQFGGGNSHVMDALAAEEGNLLHAWQLARDHQWWSQSIGMMAGLITLYLPTGRSTEWSRLVKEMVPDFIDLATNGPLPGREEDWSIVTEYRVRLAEEAHDWNEAERLQRMRVQWNRERAKAALTQSQERLTDNDRNSIRSLSVALHELGQCQRALNQPDCVTAYEESSALNERIGYQTGAAICAFNLGHAYKYILSIRDLDRAEYFYRRSLELSDERDLAGRAARIGQLGAVALERFEEASKKARPEPERLSYLNAAVRSYLQALELHPSEAIPDLAVTHHQLGRTYSAGGDYDRALAHYRESIRYEEMSGNLYGAAETRVSVAATLANRGRFGDALEYAHAALKNFKTYGDRAADKIQKTNELIANIEKDMRTL